MWPSLTLSGVLNFAILTSHFITPVLFKACSYSLNWATFGCLCWGLHTHLVHFWLSGILLTCKTNFQSHYSNQQNKDNLTDTYRQFLITLKGKINKHMSLWHSPIQSSLIGMVFVERQSPRNYIQKGQRVKRLSDVKLTMIGMQINEKTITQWQLLPMETIMVLKIVVFKCMYTFYLIAAWNVGSFAMKIPAKKCYLCLYSSVSWLEQSRFGEGPNYLFEYIRFG